MLNEALAAFPGTLSLALLDGAGQPLLLIEAERRWPSASLIKVPLAWQWLQLAPAPDWTLAEAEIDDPDGSLAACVGQTLPRLELARRMIIESENNATNLVLGWCGGVGGANRWLAARGWTAMRWERRMLDWQARAAGRDNWTSALAMARVMHALHLSAEPGTATLRRWLGMAIGTGKLEAAAPPGAQIAHKTGDLPDGHEHDAGTIVLADGRWVALAALSRSTQPPEVASAALAAVLRAALADALPDAAA